jgi:hypothetical protein
MGYNRNESEQKNTKALKQIHPQGKPCLRPDPPSAMPMIYSCPGRALQLIGAIMSLGTEHQAGDEKAHGDAVTAEQERWG